MPVTLPVPPTRSFGFNSFSSTNPTSQQPGDKIDINLDAGFAFDAAILTWSRTVVADTGGLKAGIVTMANLDTGLFNAITAAVAPNLTATVTTATAAASQAVASAALALSYSNTAAGYVTAASGFSSTAQTAAGQATYQAGLALASATSATTAAINASNYRGDASGFSVSASNSAYVARMWADYLPDNLPSDVLTLSGVSGTRYSARYHAAAASSSASTASTAATTASSASGSAVAALALVQAAQADVAMKSDSFRTVYLGPQASPPTTDPLGGGVGPGDIYFDTTLNTMRVRTATSTWSDIGAPDTTGFATWAAGTFVGQMTFAPGTMAPFTVGSASQGIVVTGLRADTAVTLATARTLALSGDGTGSISFNGSANATIPMTLAASGVAAGTYALATVTVDAKGRVTVASSNTAAAIALTNATASTSTTTGALKIAGGLGVAGAIFAASLTATGAVNAASGTYSGAVSVGSTLNVPSAGIGTAAITTLISGTNDASASPTAGTIRSPNSAGTNVMGVAMTLQAGQSTGTGVGGSIVFQTSLTGTTGAVANTQTTRLTIGAGATADITVPAAANLIVTNAPSADNHAARRRDVAMEWLATVVPTNVTWIEFALPTAYTSFQFAFDGVTTTSSGNLIAQVSTNGGTSWLGASTDYLYGWFGSISPGYTGAVQSSFMCLTYNAQSSVNGPLRAILNLQMPKGGAAYTMYSCESNLLTVSPSWEGAIFYGATFANPNRIRFAFASATFGTGTGQIIQKGLRA